MLRSRMVFRWFGLVGSALLMAGTASAATVTDGDDFSVELPDTLCFEMPATLHDEDACAAMGVRSYGVQWPPGATGIAVANVPVGKEGFGRLMVARTQASEWIESEEVAATVVANALHSRHDHEHHVLGTTKLYMTADGLRIIRFAEDYTETLRPAFPAEGLMRYRHQIGALALTEDATYLITAFGPKVGEAELDAIIDNALSTIRARKPLRQPRYQVFFQLGQFLGMNWRRYSLFVKVLLVVFVVFLISRGRAWLRRRLLGTG